MYCIGLTGGIATGKSTVVNMLRSYGAAIVDCDVLARDVVQPGTEALKRVAAQFGPQSLLADGTMDRAYIGRIVFNDKNRKKELEDILFPCIHQRIDEEIASLQQANPKAVVVLDMPLLYEVQYAPYVDAVWLVYVDGATQLTRLMARNHYTEAEAKARIKAQWPIDKKKDLAQVVIDNRGTLEETKGQVQQAWQQLMEHLSKA